MDEYGLLKMLNNLFLKFLTFIISLVDYSNKKKIILFFKNKLKSNDLHVIDIGTHKGETIDIFLNNFKIKKIYSFEPNKSLFNKLKSSKRYTHNKIDLYNYGVGLLEEDKFLNITTDTSSSTFNTLNSESDYYKNKNKIISLVSRKKDLIDKKQKIKIINLSNFISKKKISKIDVLKIDTEGYEFNILKGLSEEHLKKIKFIYFEHHYDLMINKGYKFYEINNLLIKNNFKKRYKLKMKFRKTFEYIYENSN